MKTRKLMAVLVMVALFVTALPVVALADNSLGYKAAGTTLTVNKTKVDVTKETGDPNAVTFTLRFRDGTKVATGEFVFFVKSNRDAEYIVSGSGIKVINDTLEDGRKVTGKTNEKGIVQFKLYSTVAGSAKISVYKPNEDYNNGENKGFDVDKSQQIGETKTLTFETDEKVKTVELRDNKKGKIEAGKNYKLTATVFDEGDYWVEDQEVTFYEYYRALGKDNYGSRKKVGTAKTNQEGEASLTLNRDKAGAYAYYARAGGVDSDPVGDPVGEEVVVSKRDCLVVKVLPASAFSVEAKDDVKYAELDEKATVKFVYKDYYDSKVKFAVEDDDGDGQLNRKTDVEVFDPKGDTLDCGQKSKEYYADWDEANDELKVTFTPDKEGKYKVRAYIPSTGIYAETVVNTAEFAEVEKLGLKLYKYEEEEVGDKVDNAAVKMWDGDDGDEEEEYLVKVFEYDKNGVERDVDASDVYFSTSDAEIATVNRDGVVTLKKDATGVVTITATHEDGELAADLDITVSGDPVGVEVDVEVDDLKAKVKLAYFDKNNNLAVEDEAGYQVMAGDLEVTDVDDFDNGKASFVLLAEEYGKYKVRVVTEEGLSVSFDVEFVEEDAKKVVEGAEKVTFFIGNDFANVDGAMEDLDAPAFIEDGRTYVPFRFLGEAFGAEVDWDPKEGLVETVTLLRDDVEVVIGIGDEFATVTADGEVEVVSFEGLGAAKIVDGRTYLPFRAVADIFGAEVDYGTDEDGFVTWVSFEQ